MYQGTFRWSADFLCMDKVTRGHRSMVPTPTHVTMSTWLGFRPIYFYTILRVKSTLLRWPLVTLSMYNKSADHLKVTWYIIRKINMVYKSTRGGGGGTGGPKVYLLCCPSLTLTNVIESNSDQLTMTSWVLRVGMDSQGMNYPKYVIFCVTRWTMNGILWGESTVFRFHLSRDDEFHNEDLPRAL